MLVWRGMVEHRQEAAGFTIGLGLEEGGDLVEIIKALRWWSREIFICDPSELRWYCGFGLGEDTKKVNIVRMRKVYKRVGMPIGMHDAVSVALLQLL